MRKWNEMEGVSRANLIWAKACSGEGWLARNRGRSGGAGRGRESAEIKTGKGCSHGLNASVGGCWRIRAAAGDVDGRGTAGGADGRRTAGETRRRATREGMPARKGSQFAIGGVDFPTGAASTRDARRARHPAIKRSIPYMETAGCRLHPRFMTQNP